MAAARDGRLARWARARAPWVMVLGECACSDECAQTLATGLEVEGFNCQLCHAPEQADILLVAGRISQKMSLLVEEICDRMQPAGKVVVWGACACSGGLASPDVVVAIDQRVEVAAFVPGCPPQPRDLVTALKLAL
ncbi:MAG: NADH-quinone oxidoreductase subunit B family protein [Candidatus Latescibacterota bacterium]